MHLFFYYRYRAEIDALRVVIIHSSGASMKLFSVISYIFLTCCCSIKKIQLSLHPKSKKRGAIAQLVEQRTENPCVPGSIPGGTTFDPKQFRFNGMWRSW